MSTPSDPRTLVMHGLRLKGFAEAAGGRRGRRVSPRPRPSRCSTSSSPTGWPPTATAGSRASRSPGRAGRARPAARRRARRAPAREPPSTAPTAGSSSSTPSCCRSAPTGSCATDGESAVNDHSRRRLRPAVIERLGRSTPQVEPICADLPPRSSASAATAPGSPPPSSGCRPASTTGSPSR